MRGKRKGMRRYNGKREWRRENPRLNEGEGGRKEPVGRARGEGWEEGNR